MDVRRLSERLRGASLSERIGLAASAVRGRVVFTTSFGLEDQALLDAIATVGAPIDDRRPSTPDASFRRPTISGRRRKQRYGLRIEVFAPRADSLESLVARRASTAFVPRSKRARPAAASARSSR